MPRARSRSSPGDDLRSLPATWWPMATRTVAMALIAAPPIPTMWIRRPGFDRSIDSTPGSTAGMTLHQLGDGVGRIGSGQRRRRLAHLLGPAGRAENAVELGRQPLRGEPVVGNDDGGAGPLPDPGVGRLVVAGRGRPRYQHR